MSKSLKNLKSPKTEKSNQKKQSNELEDILTNFTSLTSEDISNIADLIKEVAESQIKKNEAITKLTTAIFDFLSLPGNNTIKSKTHAAKTEPTLSYASGTRYTREEVLDIIKTMREKRATFATVASYLQEINIPTFSGRGDWHAQTIHRLCKEHSLVQKFVGGK